MIFWKNLLITILFSVACRPEKLNSEFNFIESECKIYAPRIHSLNRMILTPLSKSKESFSFSLATHRHIDTITLRLKEDSIYFQYQNETIGIPVKSEHKFHKWHRDTNRLFLNQYLSLGYIDVTHKNKSIRVYKYYTREDEFSQGYSVFYSLQYGILAFGYSGKVYFLEGCFDEFIADIKEHMQEEKYFFDIDTVPPLPPMPNVISDLGEKK